MENQSSLTAFIGVNIAALLKEGYSATEAKHLVVGDLLEEAMKVAQKNDSDYDNYALKPLFVALKYLLEREVTDKTKYAYVPEIATDISNLQNIINYLDNRIERTVKES